MVIIPVSGAYGYDAVVMFLPCCHNSNQVTTVHDAVARVPELVAAARQVALVPEGGGLFEHALARIAAAITFQKKGLV